MPARLSPTERIRAQIDELFAGGQPLAETLEEAARLSVRLVIQAALEAEVSEFLGRDRYQRDPDAGPGYRNGHQPVQVKTTAGPVVLERPKLRDTGEPFVSRLLGKGVSRTNALEALVLASFVRGLSVRDVEAALAEALGPEAASASRPCAGSARRSRPSSTPSPPATLVAWRWTTCCWTALTSATTLGHPPSRSWSHGA